MIAVTALGLAAAFLFALSAVLQQRAARTIVGADTTSLRDAAGVKRLLGHLVRSRTWLAGWLTNLCGVGTQAAALKVGSVAAVQPLMAAQLLFVLSLASREQRRWPSARDWLSALAVCLRDWIVVRRYDAFLILAFYFGPYLAWAVLPRTLGFLYYDLPSATFASLALVYLFRRGNSPAWLLWVFVAVACAGFAAMLPISAAFVGTSMETFDRLMIFQNWI